MVSGVELYAASPVSLAISIRALAKRFPSKSLSPVTQPTTYAFYDTESMLSKLAAWRIWLAFLPSTMASTFLTFHLCHAAQTHDVLGGLKVWVTDLLMPLMNQPFVHCTHNVEAFDSLREGSSYQDQPVTFSIPSAKRTLHQRFHLRSTTKSLQVPKQSNEASCLWKLLRSATQNAMHCTLEKTNCVTHMPWANC